MATQIWINIGSGNGLVASDQAITWNNVDLSAKGFCGVHLRLILYHVLMNLICTMCSEITIFKIISTSPRGQWLKWLGYFSFKLNFRSQVHWCQDSKVTISSETGLVPKALNHYGCRWPGALEPGHQHYNAEQNLITSPTFQDVN